LHVPLTKTIFMHFSSTVTFNSMLTCTTIQYAAPCTCAAFLTL
jgi:hypothetical protein